MISPELNQVEGIALDADDVLNPLRQEISPPDKLTPHY